MLSVFDSSDYRKFLKDQLAERSKQSRAWTSVRFAKACGFRSESALRMVLLGKRNINWNHVCAILKFLKLPPDEAQAFEALVWLNQAKQPQVRDFFQRRYRALARGKRSPLRRQLQSAPTVDDWRLGAFILFCNGRTREQLLRDCSTGLGLSAKHAELWLQSLLEKNFLAEDEGILRVPEQHTVAHDPADLRNLQQNFLLGNVAVSQKLSALSYKSGIKLYSHALEASTLELVHQEILESLGRITDTAHPEPGAERQIFQMNIQLFNVADAAKLV